jgi:Aerobic-type carbon monoxide dehydrogenase, large subunit CoxL/CutL homologs
MTSHLEDHVIPASRQREKARSNLKWIGQDMKRVEDPRLLTGKGKYIDDIDLPNMAHAAVLGSPHAHARVKSIDVSKAEKLPGVILVFTAKDAAEQTAQVASFSSPPVPQYCMAIDKIRHVGEVVAAVVAEDPYIAQDAIDLIEVEYEPLPANVDPEKAIHATGAAVLHPERGPTNCAYDQEFKFGPVDEDFAKAEVVVRRKVKWSRSGAQPIETSARSPNSMKAPGASRVMQTPASIMW